MFRDVLSSKQLYYKNINGVLTAKVIADGLFQYLLCHSTIVMRRASSIPVHSLINTGSFLSTLAIGPTSAFGESAIAHSCDPRGMFWTRVIQDLGRVGPTYGACNAKYDRMRLLLVPVEAMRIESPLAAALARKVRPTRLALDEAI